MNKLKVEPLQGEKLKIEVADTDAGIEIQFHGDIDMRDPKALLGPYFDSIHQAALANGVGEVRLNLANLQYLNSSGILTFIRWIKQIQDLEKDRRYEFSIMYNDKITWQRISILTINKMAPDVVRIQKMS